MPTNRTAQQITDLVNEAIEIDREIIAQLQALPGAPNEMDYIYGSGTQVASAIASLSAAERVQRIVSTLIQEETVDDQTSRLEEKWDLNTAELTTIDDNIGAIATDINTIKTLGDITGIGFYTRGGEGGISTALLWKQLVAEGLMNDVTEVSEEEKEEAIAKINQYLQDYSETFGSNE